MNRACIIIISILSFALAAAADCRPAGRETFTTGLDALARGDLRAATIAFEDLVRAQPDCAEARNNLAVVLVEQGRVEEAAEQLRRAVALSPDYQRARFNLARAEALLAEQRQRPRAGQPSLEVETQPQSAKVEAPPPVARNEESPPTPAHVAVAAQETARSALSSIAAIEPAGATACSIEPTSKRVCTYQRRGDVTVAGDCYSMVSVHVGSWPRWLVAGDLSGHRIRLHDETGQRRMKIAPASAGVSGDVVELGDADFEALAAKMVAWRTGCVVLQPGVGSASAEASATAIREALEGWRAAWEHKQFDAYVAQYSRSFAPQTESDAERWRARKRSLFENRASIAVDIAPPSIFMLDDGAVVTTFEQAYRSGSAVARDFKALRWQRDGERWTISAETVLKPVPSEPRRPAAGG